MEFIDTINVVVVLWWLLYRIGKEKVTMDIFNNIETSAVLPYASI